MSNCSWEIINEFTSLGEYMRFCTWLDDQVRNDAVDELSVKDSYAGPYFEERWFRCKTSGEIWRVVAPQDPFHGYWGPVSPQLKGG